MRNNSLDIRYDFAPIGIPQNSTNEKSTLVQLIMSSGNNPLLEPLLTQINVAIWRREATMR